VTTIVGERSAVAAFQRGISVSALCLVATPTPPQPPDQSGPAASSATDSVRLYAGDGSALFEFDLSRSRLRVWRMAEAVSGVAAVAVDGGARVFVMCRTTVVELDRRTGTGTPLTMSQGLSLAHACGLVVDRAAGALLCCDRTLHRVMRLCGVRV
jgi:hypothetical protein